MHEFYCTILRIVATVVTLITSLGGARFTEKRGLAGALPPLPFRKGATGPEVLFHNNS